MQQEDLNRFLQNVHRTRLVDYLEPSPGESHEQALERKLRWAARSQSSAEHAFEAAFLLQHGDALRSHLTNAKAEVVEDEWIEFGGDDPDGGTVRMYQSSSANESIDLDALLSGAGGPGPTDTSHPKAGTRPATPASDATFGAPEIDLSGDDPERQATAPAGKARSVRPAVTTRPRTPTPTAPNRRGSPARPGRAPATPPGESAGSSSASPLLERARRNSPVPHLGRIGGSRQRNPGTPSPPLLGRSRTPSPGTRTATPRPEPERWSSGQSVKRVVTPSGARSRTPSPTYTPPGAPAASHSSHRGPTPPGATPRSPTPGGYDVKIRGHAQFVRNNDQYGTAEVVYESELNHGGQLRTPMPARTPLSVNKRGAADQGDDILGSLRGSMRKGTPAQLAAIATRPQSIPPAVYLGLILLLVLILSFWTVGIYQGFLNNPFVPPVQDPQADPGVQTGLIAPVSPGPDDGTVEEPGAVDAATSTTDGTQPAVDGAAADPTTPETAGTTTTPAQTPPVKSAGTTTPADKTPDKTGATSTAGTPSDQGKTSSSTATADTQGTSSTPDPGKTAATDAGKTDATDPDTAGSAVAPAGGPDTPDVGTPPEPDKPAAATTLLGGAWIGSVGSIACLADLKQRGETISGTITVGGQPFEISGRYNEAKQSVYLRGESNEAVIFRGTVDGGRVNGTARLGAGQIYQAWQLRKR